MSKIYEKGGGVSDHKFGPSVSLPPYNGRPPWVSPPLNIAQNNSFEQNYKTYGNIQIRNRI